MDRPLSPFKLDDAFAGDSMQRMGSRTANKNGASGAEKAGSGRSGRRIETLAEGVTLILGDCLSVSRITADAVISDPPYGMGWIAGGVTPGKNGTGGTHSRHKGSGVLNDNEPFDPSPWLEYPRCVLWGANHYGARLPVGTTLVWLKRHDEGFGSFLSDAEIAWMKGGVGVYCKRDTSDRSESRLGQRVHPTQKPVPLMAWCMDRARVPQGATVLDPYMGSGTTGIACIRTGRKFIGIELDPEHFENAVRRIRDELTGCLSLGGGGAEQVGDGNGESESRAGSATIVLSNPESPT